MFDDLTNSENIIFGIRQIIEQSKEFNKSTYIAFIDFKAAFDSVSRDSLWNILQICGVPQEFSVLVSLVHIHPQRGAPLLPLCHKRSPSRLG